MTTSDEKKRVADLEEELSTLKGELARKDSDLTVYETAIRGLVQSRILPYDAWERAFEEALSGASPNEIACAISKRSRSPPICDSHRDMSVAEANDEALQRAIKMSLAEEFGIPNAMSLEPKEPTAAESRGEPWWLNSSGKNLGDELSIAMSFPEGPHSYRAAEPTPDEPTAASSAYQPRDAASPTPEKPKAAEPTPEEPPTVASEDYKLAITMSLEPQRTPGNASTDNKGGNTQEKPPLPGKKDSLVYSYNAKTDTGLLLQKRAFMRHVKVFEGLSEIEAQASWQRSPKEVQTLNAGAPDQRQVLHVKVSRDVRLQPTEKPKAAEVDEELQMAMKLSLGYAASPDDPSEPQLRQNDPNEPAVAEAPVAREAEDDPNEPAVAEDDPNEPASRGRRSRRSRRRFDKAKKKSRLAETGDRLQPAVDSAFED